MVASRVQPAIRRKADAVMIAGEYNAFINSDVIAMRCYQGHLKSVCIENANNYGQAHSQNIEQQYALSQ